PPEVRRITDDLGDREAYDALGREDWDVVCQFLGFDLPCIRADSDIYAGRYGQYVFISSTSAYRKPPTGYVMTENVPPGPPYWPYSQAQADTASHPWAQHDAGRLAVTIVRPSHTLRSRFPGGITTGDDWAWRMLNDKPIIVQGDGTSLWTITHSADFASMFCNLLGNPAASGEAFHITRH
ncbi:MAG: NAD-dependent epimerase/dehydratase family protein, partial [bacterium]|nr:NAD-dependent epimerase/dehydratase family protein [bacterium]